MKKFLILAAVLMGLAWSGHADAQTRLQYYRLACQPRVYAQITWIVTYESGFVQQGDTNYCDGAIGTGQGYSEAQGSFSVSTVGLGAIKNMEVIVEIDRYFGPGAGVKRIERHSSP